MSSPLDVGTAKGDERALTPVDLLALFELEEAQQPEGRLVGERIASFPEGFDRVEHLRFQHTVDTGEKLPCRPRADELLEERLERRVVRAVEVVRRLPQLGNPLPQPTAMLRVLPEVQRKRAFCFPLRHGVQVGAEDEQRSMLDPGKSPYEPYGLGDGRSGRRGVAVRAEPGERGSAGAGSPPASREFDSERPFSFSMRFNRATSTYLSPLYSNWRRTVQLGQAGTR